MAEKQFVWNSGDIGPFEIQEKKALTMKNKI